MVGVQMNSLVSDCADLNFSRMGESAILCQVSSPLSESTQRRIWQLTRLASEWPFVQEAISGMNNLMVIYDAARIRHEHLELQLKELWPEVANATFDGKDFEIPVVYGGEFGPDLPQVALRCGLKIQEVIERHSRAHYTVFAIGADPGFAYLAGLDPGLYLPRLDTPRLQIPAGSIIIAGQQAGIQPISAPCGWHVIGRTDAKVFDIARERPALLRAGDHVVFSIKDIAR
ncbi:5-oxoprolinase subunit PxpB [Bradyrhizobium sp. BWA-3-5]|uniref:5-oxoprolinase subunit PxpB n=1 Tax=Bradyrhizobium sp. BWA-3-5 TaxID=3080013 RepID=UPI00293F6C2D|nr:5-oxoprolinase subunit PxpB [Bradyrhizobium sp. BWA-3-5]WOH63753.1 5-oxoprolinase subunit PxpB [Bradyrhizobium sp. BWA-3-5]